MGCRVGMIAVNTDLEGQLFVVRGICGSGGGGGGGGGVGILFGIVIGIVIGIEIGARKLRGAISDSR